MSIGIVGAGAIGLLLASTLGSKMEVSLYVRRNEQKTSLEQNGIHLLGDKTVKDKLQIKRTTDPWVEDLIILAVKQPTLPAVLSEHSFPHHKGQALLFLQNGMSHLEIMKRSNYKHLFIGVVEHGVRKVNDFTIEWRGVGRIRCGAFKGDRIQLNPFLKASELHSEWTEDWFQILQDKLLVNAVINPLTALYKVENGQLFANSHFRQLAYLIFNEAAEVLGLPQDQKKEKWDYILQIGERTATNRSSMLQDLEAQRSTEVDAILGYLLKAAEADKRTIVLPLLSFLDESIKGLESKGSQ